MTQEEALTILKTGANVFLTGEPGSGKTHTVNQYVAYLHSCGIEPAVTASTGIAATHIGGMTIHSWSGIGVKEVVTEYDLEFIEQKERVVRRVRSAHVLIIDEVSMLSADTLSSVDAVCRHLRHSSQPFGGLQVLLVGDFFQLPPIGRGEDPERRFAFHSPAWDAAKFIPCYLDEQHRQKDGDLLTVLSIVRNGRDAAEARAILKKRRVDAPKEDITRLYPHNANVDNVNDEHLQSLPGSVRTFFMQSSGAPHLVEALKRSCLSPEHLFLKVGAKVMFTKNDPQGEYVNGTQGEVIEFGKISRNPVVKMRSGEIIEVSTAEWPVMDGTHTLAKIVQIPLRLAWAITVHKSQGMSLDAAVIDLGQAFEYGQGYVALSRVRTLSGLYLLGLNERALEVHPEVAEQDALFRELSDEAGEAFEEMEKKKLSALHEAFLRACGGVKGVGRKAPQSKPKQGSTYEITKELLKQKLDILEIAQKRGMTLGTIISHLEKLKAQGDLDPKRDLAHIQIDPERMTEIKQAFKKVSKKGGMAQLTPVIQQLDSSYTFEELKIARLFL